MAGASEHSGEGSPGSPHAGSPHAGSSDAGSSDAGSLDAGAAAADPLGSAPPEPGADLIGEVEAAFAESGEVTPLEDPLEAVSRERDDYRDALIRLQADFENYKKRVRNQQAELLDRAAEALVEKLLPVLDTADLAVAHGGGEDVKQVTAALAAALEREGLERIDPQGGPFDPTLHDAVAHEPGEGEGGQEVAEVLRAGYRWKGRVVRPAMVKVRG